MRGAATTGTDRNRRGVTTCVQRFGKRGNQVFAYRNIIVMKSHKSLCRKTCAYLASRP